MKPPNFKVTSQLIARNPVAQAIERANQRQVARDFAIKLHVLGDGEAFGNDGVVVARLITVALRLLDMRNQGDNADARVMRGGLSALIQASQRNWAWRRIDAPAIDEALTRALWELSSARALDRQAAYQFVIDLEEQA